MSQHVLPSTVLTARAPTRPQVMVMEYVPGVKVNNAEAIDRLGLDRQRLARLAVESYLQ